MSSIFFGSAQDAVHNFGHLKIHNQGAVGFHHNFFNDGITDDNLGLAGFYSDIPIYIDGAFTPVFYDMEIMASNDLFLGVSVHVANNTNYILGDIVTPRTQSSINLDYLDNTFYSGNNDLRKVDGFSALTNKTNFTFPIGYGNRLRALQISSDINITEARSAYFLENPDNPTTLTSKFYTSQKADDISAVSTFEFWCLEGTIPSWIELTWDTESNLQEFVDDIEDLKIVGYHAENDRWENLGGLNISGDLDAGSISSEVFIADEYSSLTFGSSKVEVIITLGNYILTPNNDGINDFLVIDGIERSPKNELQIFNRWGRMVYSAEDYQGTFNGVANVNMVVEESDGLPDGIYFYIIDLKDIGLKYQGYMYLIYQL